MTRRDQMLERISVDPKVCFGKPVIKGTRIWVPLILDFLAHGDTIEAILQEYPQLTRRTSWPALHSAPKQPVIVSFRFPRAVRDEVQAR